MMESKLDFKQYLHIRPDVKTMDLLFLKPSALRMLAFAVSFCAERNLKCDITSIYRGPNDGFSKSRTHQEYRAFDISVIGFTTDDIDDLLIETREKFQEEGAKVWDRTGDEKVLVSRPVIYHNVGRGKHFHFQVHP